MTTSYSQLVSETPIVLMAQNRTLADNMGLVIRQAEDEIYETLDHDAFRGVVQTPISVTPGNDRFDLSIEADPVFEVRAVQLVYGDITVNLRMREIERMIATFSPSNPNVPRFYAEDQGPLQYRVFPHPDATYNLRITANLQPGRLGLSNEAGLLASRYPRLLTMAVYRHGARFMRNTADEARYAAAFSEALRFANDQLARRRRDDTDVTVADTVNTV